MSRYIRIILTQRSIKAILLYLNIKKRGESCDSCDLLKLNIPGRHGPAYLLRREYYDPLDKPGMAELIVAKNRHGGIGSVNLSFRKELAQFANFTPMHIGDGEPVDDEAFAQFTPE